MRNMPAPPLRLRVTPCALAAGLLAMQFLVIGMIFKHAIDFDCRANWGIAACGTASKSLAALYCMIAAVGLFSMLRPHLFLDLLAEAGHDARPLLLNLAGFILSMIPVLMLQGASGTSMMIPAFALWVPGMAMILAGLCGWLAPWQRWRAFLAQTGLPLAVALVASGMAPALAVRLQPIWQMERISDMTFRVVTMLIEPLGYDLYVDPVLKHIGEGDFILSIAPACSGIEGIALVMIFVSLYLWLFRSELRFPRAFLLFPAGIAASMILNAVRIAVLLLIGLHGRPELAVGGFHSHAGWMMFTIVALGIILIARRVPALHRAPTLQAVRTNSLPPLWRDPVAARILPFAVFMLTAVVAPAISTNPAMLYPIRVILLTAAVALVWPALQGIVWRISPTAWLAGGLVGLMWIVIPVEPSNGPLPYGTLSGGMVTVWFVFRGIGTVLLVPLVEELFFRDYLEHRLRGTALDQPAPVARLVMSALITAGLFAALHDRWAEAFVAGLVFSIVACRSGRISDAIAAHATANLIVFSVAALTGNLAII
ncbi:exosortase E/protease, VPEID-CTERM system [Paracoccus sp. JM45]|uniref:exosortase E/protease, VPEID-CTERM system n=1 Tax=Paracoccus sp. JM45 TaxID=2283626 RepID=UPI000E6CC18F|nr:exosortase E/protease, VPEID-CTERM system [Paracoccus sp. JM45]RJE78541.1 exosortase E/protease, VPEID-CTERM system [Paracoccus sp. JM45]